MTSTATQPPTAGARTRRRPDRPATATVISAFGILVALAGLEHGIGELLQGPVAPDGLLIASWPDAAAFEILSGEPAMTVVPNLLVTGILAIAVSTAFGVWAVQATRRRHGGGVLIALSLLLLLVGGGLGPPLMGALLGLTALRAAHPSHRPPGRVGRLSALWPTFTVVGIVGYLALMPGTLLLSAFAGVESTTLVLALGAVAFGGLLLALPAALAADRLPT